MNEREKKASEKYEDLRGYKVEYFTPQLRMNETDFILYSLFDGNLVDAEATKSKSKRKSVMQYYYRKRVAELNQLLTGIEMFKNKPTEN